MARLEGTWLKNRYRIDELIGTGATAEVYCAQDTALNQVVTLKLLKLLKPAW